MRIVMLSLLATALLPLASCSSGFQEADIQAVKTSIREEFSKDPRFSVIDVVMVKESPTKLTGFVKLNMTSVGELMKACTATMAEDGRNSVWRCGL